jgi:hypothetical protein
MKTLRDLKLHHRNRTCKRSLTISKLFQQSDLSEDEKAEIRKKSEEAAKEAAEMKPAPKADFCVREWLPYNDYAVPDVLDPIELHWGVPTVQRLWFR